jgi:DNA-binding GntR family transcriptional regulator
MSNLHSVSSTRSRNSRSVRRTSAIDVAEHLRRQIFEGYLREGQHIRKEDIAAELGISRIPVREALVALDREGWLRIVPHKGTYVQAFNESSVRDHYEVLGFISGLAVRHAADHATTDELRRIRDHGRRLIEEEDVATFDHLTMDFWRQIFEMARSPRLTSMWRAMTAVVPGSFFAEVPGAMERQQYALVTVLRHLGRRRGQQAETACARMVSSQADLVVELLRERKLLDT